MVRGENFFYGLVEAHIPSFYRVEWDRQDAFPYLGQVPLPRWALPRWAQEFHNHRNTVGRASKSPVGGVTLKLLQAGSSFVLEAPLSLEYHNFTLMISLKTLSPNDSHILRSWGLGLQHEFVGDPVQL